MLARTLPALHCVSRAGLRSSSLGLRDEKRITKETMMRNEMKIVEEGVILDELEIEEVEELVAPAVLIVG